MPSWEDFQPFIVTGLALGGVYALSGVGLVVLYRATGVLNLAFGAIGAGHLAGSMLAGATANASTPRSAGAGLTAAHRVHFFPTPRTAQQVHGFDDGKEPERLAYGLADEGRLAPFEKR